MTPEDAAALLGRLAPAPPPDGLERRILRTAGGETGRTHRRLGRLAVAAALLACFGLLRLIVAFRPEASPAGPGQEGPVASSPTRVTLTETGALTFDVLGALCHAAFSPDVRRLAALFFDGSVVMWSVPDGREIARANLRRQGVQFVERKPQRIAFTPDGRELVLTDDLRIGLYDATTLERKRLFPNWGGTPSPDFHVAVRPGGREVAWADGSSHVTVSTIEGSLRAGTTLQVEPLPPRPGAQALVNSLQYSADGRRLLAADGRVAHVLDADTLESQAVVEEPVNGIREARFAAGDQFVVTRSRSGRVTVWSLDAGSAVATAETGPENPRFSHPLFHAVGPWIFTSGGDRTHHLLAFDAGARTLSLVRRVSAPGDEVFVSPDGKWLLHLVAKGQGMRPTLVRLEPQ